MNRERNRAASASFNTCLQYFEMMRDWHRKHGGVAVEPEMKSFIEQNCKTGYRVMEAGCGEGSIVNWFAYKNPESHFVDIDISQIGVEMAKENAAINAEFRCADLKSLPFKNDFFDFIFSQSVLEHVVQWEQAVKEICRVLKKDGDLLIRVGNSGRRGKKLIKALTAYLMRRNKVKIINPSFELKPGDYHTHMTNFDVQEIPSDVLRSVLKKIGFRIVYFSTRFRLPANYPQNWKNAIIKFLAI